MTVSFLPADTDGPDATQALGARLAVALPPGSVVALTGDLGAGKTHLAKGVAEGLGLDPSEVTSPTFTIVQEYAEVGLVHLDLYRIERAAEVDALGLDDLLDAFDVALVEWPERAFGRLPADTVWLRLDHLGGDRRRISLVEAPGDDGPADAYENRPPFPGGTGERPKGSEPGGLRGEGKAGSGRPESGKGAAEERDASDPSGTPLDAPRPSSSAPPR